MPDVMGRGTRDLQRRRRVRGGKGQKGAGAHARAIDGLPVRVRSPFIHLTSEDATRKLRHEGEDLGHHQASEICG